MNAYKFAYSFILAGALTVASGVPSRANDAYSPPASPQAVPAEQYAQPAIGQSAEPREPVYVWQGNRIPAPGSSAPGSSALGNPGVPHAIEVGSVRYITGGIGEEERDALNSVKNDYNLHITSTNSNGEYNGDTMVTISDRNGATLLNVEAGPLFYAALPAGTYIVKASTGGGQTEERKVTVGASKASSVYFRW